LPVAPAAHYLSGGVCTDLDGASTAPGLWACGEAACSGVHGANRLASNSLLDGLVFARRAVDAIVAGKDAPDESGVLRGVGDIDAVAPSETVHFGTGGRAELQQLMTREAGVLRDAESLDRAAAGLAALDAPDSADVRNLIGVSRALVAAARAREESRGTHTRLDFPERSNALRGRFLFADGSDPSFVPLAAAAPEPAR
jgi:L-aspartate oxidase